MLVEKPFNILDRCRGVVHKDADRQCEAAERHGVDRFPDQVQDDNWD